MLAKRTTSSASRARLARASLALCVLGSSAAEAQQPEARLDEISVAADRSAPVRPADTPAPPPPQPAPPASTGPGILEIRADSFSPITEVSRARILRDQPRTLGDALADRPGLSASGYAPGAASRPIVRGLDNARVRIQENGVGIGDVSELGEDHAVSVNPLVSDRIEVIRGPATLRYGSNAIGGVVSADNNRVPTFIPANGIAGQVSTGYSSVDNGRFAAATVDAGRDGVAVHADGFRTANDSYRTPLGIQRNSAAESQGGSVGISAIGDRGFVGISFSHYDALYGVPGIESAEHRTRLDPRQDRVLARGEYRFLNGPFEVLRVWAGGSVYRHDEIGLAEEGVGDEIHATFKNREVEARAELSHMPATTAFGTLTGMIGLQSGRRVLNSFGESFLPPTESRATGLYLFEELNVGNGLRVQAAGRIEGDRVAGIARDFPASGLPGAGGDPLAYALTRRFSPKSASLGALQELPFGFVGGLTASYAERAPSAYELFSQGPHEATATFELGDPSLRLERARTIELSLRRAIGPLRLDATGYVTRYTGFIYKRDTGLFCGEDFSSCGLGDELRQIVYSQANARFHGAEIAGQLDLLPVGDGFAGIEARYDFVRAKLDNGSNVPRIPPHRVGGGVFLRAEGWFARVTILHAFAQNETAPFETRTPGYDDLRAEISRTTPLDPTLYGFSEVTLGLQGRNLLNDEIRYATSFKKDEVLQPGRNLQFFLSARF